MKKILTALLLSASLLTAGCSAGTPSDSSEAPAIQEEQQQENSSLSAMTSQEIVSSMTIG